MAKNITQITLITTRPAGFLMYGGAPDGGNPYGYSDRAIEWDDLVLDIEAGITTNETDIQTNADAITDLENINKLQRNLNVNSAASFTLPANGVLFEVNFSVVSGTPTVLVGTSAGGSQIKDSGVITSGYYIEQLTHRNTVSAGVSASQTIHYTVSGGTVHIHTFYRILSTT